MFPSVSLREAIAAVAVDTGIEGSIRTGDFAIAIEQGIVHLRAVRNAVLSVIAERVARKSVGCVAGVESTPPAIFPESSIDVGVVPRVPAPGAFKVVYSPARFRRKPCWTLPLSK
jgi:hypothetical protein